MKKLLVLCIIPAALSAAAVSAQDYREGGTVRVAITRNPYGAAPAIMAEGLPERLMEMGCRGNWRCGDRNWTSNS